MYQAEKRYGHENGWSATFRQHKADSHCNWVHGYALAFTFTFECVDLDARDWCYDFGGLKDLKLWLQSSFDHRTIVARDDPHADWFRSGELRGVLSPILWVERIGCESFAELAAAQAQLVLTASGQEPRVRLVSVRVSEHAGNSATYFLGVTG